MQSPVTQNQASRGGEGEPVRFSFDSLLSGSDRRQVHQECVSERTVSRV